MLEMRKHERVHEISVHDETNFDGVCPSEGQDVGHGTDDRDWLRVPVELWSRLVVGCVGWYKWLLAHACKYSNISMVVGSLH